jgi:hypothetical protein
MSDNGLSPKERAENQQAHFASMVYRHLLALNNELNEAASRGVKIGLAGELDLTPVIQDVKKYFKK